MEADRNAFGRAVKRLRAGKPPQPGVPEPRSGLQPAGPETWQLECDVCERLARQYRCVGDALAWRVFGFQRENIVALCQNAPPGVMAGKEGLAAELARVDQAYQEDGQFAILRDLTNCLRIGDMTVFGNDGSVETLEAKSDPDRALPVNTSAAWGEGQQPSPWRLLRVYVTLSESGRPGRPQALLARRPGP